MSLFKREPKIPGVKANVDHKDYKDMLNDKHTEKLYGKNILTSYKDYFKELEDCTSKDFELVLERLYALFKYNVVTLLSRNFITYKWVVPDDLLTATKGMIWDWTDDVEEKKCMGSILYHGLYFPIITYNRGILHNQIKPIIDIDTRNMYNCLDGNHRVDAIKTLYEMGKFYSKVLILIMPSQCQYYCNSNRHYTPIDYDKELPDICDQKLPYPVQLFHLYKCEDEMKFTNLEVVKPNTHPGVNLVNVTDYQAVLRILEEFQNVLEVPLTKYFDKYGKLPEYINVELFNDPTTLGKAIHNKECVLEGFLRVCFGKSLNRDCNMLLCCRTCHKRMKCNKVCQYAKRFILENNKIST